MAVKRPAAAAVMATAALAAVVMLTTYQEGYQQQQLSVLEEVDPDEPINLSAAITGINPPSGPFRGGNEVTITGEGLLGGVGGLADVHKVLVGGVPVRRIVKASPQELTVVLGHRSTREHATGPASVAIVSRSKGQTVASGIYTFNSPPRLIAVRPDNGPHEGGNEVTIRGRHLAGKHDDKVTVLIDGEPCKVLRMSQDSIRVKAPARKRHARRHTAHVVVTSQAYGTSKLRRSYTYNPAPAITHVAPVEGPWNGGNLLRIHGDMLTSGQGRTNEQVTVLVGGKEAEVLSFSPNSVTVRAPKHATPGLVTVQITSSVHGRSLKAKAYRYHNKPVITAISPDAGALSGGDHVLIRGRHLGKGDIRNVRFGLRRAKVLRASQDGDEILVETRRFSHSEQGRGVQVTLTSTTFGKVSSHRHAFKVGKQASIMGISPRDGPCEGGTLITVTGRNLANRQLAQGDSADDEMLIATVAGAKARVMEQSGSKVVLRTTRCPLGAARGVISLSAPSLGLVTTPYSLKFKFNALPMVQHLTPEVGPFQGGGDVLLRGDRLCHGDCEDLVSVRIGNAFITKFVSKSSRRLIFSAPSAQQAGGSGEKTVVVNSKRYGRTVVPRGFTVAPMGAKGSVYPSNVPAHGGSTITIEAPDLLAAGQASNLGVELAGVPAQVLSVTGSRLVVAAGNLRKSPMWHDGLEKTGVSGDIVVTATVHGKKFAKDLGLSFRYNAACSIEAVAVRPGAHGGELALLIAGSNLGFGDETITVDGAPAKVHRRERRDENVFRHHATVPHMASEVAYVEVQSRRSGKCVWNAIPSTLSTPTTKTTKTIKADATFDAASSVSVKQPNNGHFVPAM